MESRLEIAEQAQRMGMPQAPFPGGPQGYPGAGPVSPYQRPWMEVEPEIVQPPMYIYPNGTYASAPQMVPTATHIIGKRHALASNGPHAIFKRETPPPLYMFIRPFPTSNIQKSASKRRQKRDTPSTPFTNIGRSTLHDRSKR